VKGKQFLLKFLEWIIRFRQRFTELSAKAQTMRALELDRMGYEQNQHDMRQAMHCAAYAQERGKRRETRKS